MASYSNNRQLVLFDGDNNHQIEKYILNDLKCISQVKLVKCANPADQLLKTAYTEVATYCYVHVICDEKPNYMQDLIKIHKKHTNIHFMGMNRSNIYVQPIIYRLQQYNDLAGISSSIILNNKLILDNYQCPRCSKTFKLHQDLEQHYQENHVSITINNIYMDYLGMLKAKKKSDPDERHKCELYCLVCRYGWQTFEARENHIISEHPNATADDSD
ncbi:unnamed protein product [Rotaria sp. Silwood1]|nr:unnamed protein product [Rotaria sp. Silwood1]CAF3718471.1 unnamed protein product [Rotaria sp. Silwood1]CAF3800243.1 unnamed protein product [Rotaria sp. Silwood1]CAF5095028.1 unnamed protein product [Rotaria sp. Silwood1]